MAAQMFLPPVADTLLLQFKTLAKARVDAATPQDRGESPGDPVYEKVLNGLNLVARHAAMPLLDALLTWRKEALNQAARAGNEISVLRKRLAVETVFLEASFQLVGRDSSGLSERQADALERLAFDWILNAEKYVEPKYSELGRARERVTTMCAEIIGAMSRTRLTPIANRYFKELEARLRVDTTAARQEILQMCSGMKCVRLQVRSDAELRASTDFLQRVHPLKHVAPVRKSQVHHAICDMMSSILQPNWQADVPRSLKGQLDPTAMSAWFRTLTLMRTELAAWNNKQSKHALVGYPLVTLLTCLEDDTAFPHYIDSLVDSLHRQLKDKVLRTLILGCLYQCIRSYLLRFAAAPAARDKLAKWLTRVTKPILTNLRRGNFQFAEQQDQVVAICVVAGDMAPEFGIPNLILELMAADASNWDCTMIGLRALLDTLSATPARVASIKAAAGQAATAKDSEPEDLLGLIRSGVQPLEVLGVPQLAAKVSASLSRILQSCHQIFANFRQINAVKPLSELIPKEKVPGLAVFAAALRCVPLVLPDHWAGARIAEDLPAYTIHADPAVRAAAADAMRRLLRSMPRMRNGVLQGMAAFVARIPDDFPDNIRESLLLLLSLMEEWIAILDEKAKGTFREPPNAASLWLDLPRVEGVGLSFMCSADCEVRRMALAVLRCSRALHGRLLALAPQPSAPLEDGRTASGGSGEADGFEMQAQTYVMDVIEEVGAEVAGKCYWDWGPWSDLWRLWRRPGEGSGEKADVDFQVLLERSGGAEDGVRWARCLSEVIKYANIVAEPATRAAYAEICNRLQALMYKDSSGRLVTPAEDGPKLELCRTYCAAAAACPPHPASQRGQPPTPTAELVRLLLLAIRAGPEAYQQVAIFALGYGNPRCFRTIVEEAAALVEEYTAAQPKGVRLLDHAVGAPLQMLQVTRSRVRREELRLPVAHLFRVMADCLQPGQLRQDSALRGKLLEWTAETLKHLSSPPAELTPEVQQMRYCLCGVARAVSAQLAQAMPSAFGPPMRKSLFDAFASWCEEGASPGRYRPELMRLVATARSRVKDPSAAGVLEADLLEASEMLEYAAYTAMAAMLLGPAFDTDSKRQGGKAMSWLDRMCTAKQQVTAGFAGPSKESTARVGLLNLLRCNPEMFDICVDHCYSPEAAVARAYFHVLVEVYTVLEVAAKTHVLLSLVLYKIIDHVQEVRDDALHMLDLLSARAWHSASLAREEGDEVSSSGRVAVVIGSLQDSYQQFQYQLSAKLARDHPELSELLCVEMITRQLDGLGKAVEHQVLTCLAPWMENLSFAARWEGNWSERLLKSMYYVTWQHGTEFPHEVERLWGTVARNKRNIIPILDFLISRGVQECSSHEEDPVLQYFSVAKRISLLLARVSPQPTIDHLAYEIGQQLLLEDEPAGAGNRRTSDTQQQMVLEFHHPTRNVSKAASGSGLEYLRRTSASGSLQAPQGLLRQGSGKSDNSSQTSLALMSMADSAMGGARSRSETRVTPTGSRRPSDGHPYASSRGLLSRPELALCLLAEVAYEHDEDLRPHLALLLHACLLAMDAGEALVHRHAQLVLLNLLYSLSADHLELHRTSGAPLSEYGKVNGLIEYLQSVAGRQLWPSEDASLAAPRPPSADALAALVRSVAAGAAFEPDLQDRWAAEALRWMLEAASRHQACRSHQVYRALRPAMTQDAARNLLGGLHKCLLSPSPASLNVAVELILTIQALVEGIPVAKMVLYPQLLLTCLALLPLSYVHFHVLVLDLLAKVLERLDLNKAINQNVLLAWAPAAPDGLATRSPAASPKGPLRSPGGRGAAEASGLRRWELGEKVLGQDHLLTLQQLLVKGLFRTETELLTVQVLTQLARQLASARYPTKDGKFPGPATDPDFRWSVLNFPDALDSLAPADVGGIASVLGDPQAQLAISIFSLMPWLCVHFRHSPHAPAAQSCIEALAAASEAAGYREVGASLLLLGPRSEGRDLATILDGVCQPLTAAFFPLFAKLAFQRCMELLKRGEEVYHAPSLLLLRCIFRVPGLQLGPATRFTSDAQLFSPVAALLESHLSRQALQVLDAVMQFSDRHLEARNGSPGAVHTVGAVLHWSSCMDDSGMDNKVAVDVLGRIVDACWGNARKGGRASKLMPFIEHIARPSGY